MSAISDSTDTPGTEKHLIRKPSKR